MEKVERRQQVVKWQLILGAVVCAIVAFCALPNFVLMGQAADVETETVKYVDKEWNPETKQVDTITTITDENGESLPL